MNAILKKSSSELAITLVEMLITLTLSTVLAGMAATQFFSTTQTSHDELVVLKTEEKTRALLDLLSYEIRMIGAGMPLSQGDFSTFDVTLADAPSPILTTSTVTTLNFRRNETGNYTVLTTDYTPSGVDLDFDVLSASNLLVGDFLYLSNLYQGGETGLRGIITGISTNTVTIDSSFITPVGSIFSSGSAVHRVSELTLDSPMDGSGITRTTELGTIVLTPNSTFTLEYQDQGGNALIPPLTLADIEENLHIIELTLQVTSDQNLRSGVPYVATTEQRIALRNLIMN